MAGFESGPDDDVISGINITPLVDIILVILIIFIVTTSYVVRSQIQVDLPQAASGQSEVQKTLVFQVTKEGEYKVDGESKSLSAIGQLVTRQKRQNPNVKAVIAADKKVIYQKVISLIDTLKQNGLDAFALNIEKTKG
jgi:biopolymer transport protein ExbD